MFFGSSEGMAILPPVPGLVLGIRFQVSPLSEVIPDIGLDTLVSSHPTKALSETRSLLLCPKNDTKGWYSAAGERLNEHVS